MPRVLVADDEAITRCLIANALQSAGYQTLTASDGAEALALARSHRPDLVLLDYHMPLVNGADALKRIRIDPGLSDTPVLILTAANLKHEVLQAAQHKPDGYLLKSGFDAGELLERVGQLLDPPSTEAPTPANHESTPVRNEAARSNRRCR